MQRMTASLIGQIEKLVIPRRLQQTGAKLLASRELALSVHPCFPRTALSNYTMMLNAKLPQLGKGLPRTAAVPVVSVVFSSPLGHGSVQQPFVAAEWRCQQRRLLSRRTNFAQQALQDAQPDSPAAASVPAQLVPPTDPNAYCVLNFYHLTPIADPQAAVEEHRAYVERQGLDIRGRIYISSQGMNCQYGGTVADATAYVEWVKQQPGFEGLFYTVWPSEGHAYPKLRLKYKPNLISLAGGMEVMPITDPAARATPLPPNKWKEMVGQAKEKNDMVVLDLRNDYEWDAGHFVGADRPAEEVFAETPVGEGEQEVPQPLQGKDKDTTVLMYCTGGIRCDVYSTFLRKKGFNNLYTLEYGVQNYFRHEGGAHWNGSLFVFDARMAISPNTTESGALPAAVPCSLCGSEPELPHVNCANVDCNELFIACAACKSRLKGCCCEECMSAPRLLRPAKLEGGQYGSWGNYADRDEMGPIMAQGRSHEGRVARRTRRREALKERRLEFLEQKLARKQKERAEGEEAAAPEVSAEKKEEALVGAA